MGRRFHEWAGRNKTGAHDGSWAFSPGQVRSGLDFSTKRGRQARWNRMDGFQSLKTGPDRGREGGKEMTPTRLFMHHRDLNDTQGNLGRISILFAHVLQVPFM
jgi:hypothetical protein